MKIFLFTLLITSLWLGTKAQTLPSPAFGYLPFGASGVIIIDSVPGASYYEWTTITGMVNDVLFNSNLSPEQTSIPQVSYLVPFPKCTITVCVQAFNVCCSSAVVCTTIIDTPPIILDSLNSSIAAPNTTGTYNVYFPEGTANGFGIVWETYGDITLNGTGTDSVYTDPLNAPFVELHFGPNFTSGTLCAGIVGISGLLCYFVCMPIYNTVAIAEISAHNYNVWYNSINDEIEFNSINSGEFIFEILDSDGRLISSANFHSSTGTINADFLADGLYIIRFITHSATEVKKIVVSETR